MSFKRYRIRVVAEMVGLSENLLRVWERRYRIVEPTRGPSGYRTYSDDDVALLRRVKTLTAEGMAIGDIAHLLPGLREAVRDDASAPQNVVALPVANVAAWRARLLAAAHATQQDEVELVLDEAFARLRPLDVFEQVMVPVLREVGERWHEGRLSIAQEHLVTHAVRSRLVSVLEHLPRGVGPHALCAGFPDDEHEVGLLGAALRLREAGLRVTYLGARTPVPELLAVARTLAPEVVALSATRELPEAAFAQVLSAVCAGLPLGTAVLVGGRGAERFATLIERLGATLAHGGPVPLPEATLRPEAPLPAPGRGA